MYTKHFHKTGNSGFIVCSAFSFYPGTLCRHGERVMSTTKLTKHITASIGGTWQSTLADMRHTNSPLKHWYTYKKEITHTHIQQRARHFTAGGFGPRARCDLQEFFICNK